MIYEKLLTQTKPMPMAELIALFDSTHYDKPLSSITLATELMKIKGSLVEISIPDKREKKKFYTAIKK